jgi:hypothetical protein
MDGKIKRCVCIKFCLKLGKSTTETLEKLHEAFGGHSLSQTVVFEWHSRFKDGRVSVEALRKMTPTVLLKHGKKRWDRCIHSQGDYFEGDGSQN